MSVHTEILVHIFLISQIIGKIK